MAVDSVETADYYKDKIPKLFGGLGRMSDGDFSTQLREDAVPFALKTPRRVPRSYRGWMIFKSSDVWTHLRTRVRVW